MSGYRLSSIRNKGWQRLGLTGAVGMIPYTAMEHALGRFSEGPAGWQQAAEFLAGGICIWLVVGFSMAWVMHGFAVKAHDDESDERRPSSPTGHAAPSHATAPSHSGAKPH